MTTNHLTSPVCVYLWGGGGQKVVCVGGAWEGLHTRYQCVCGGGGPARRKHMRDGGGASTVDDWPGVMVVCIKNNLWVDGGGGGA